MATESLKQKAIALLNRRKLENSPWFYLQSNWKRWILYKALLLALILTIYVLMGRFIAMAFACFVVGAALRDIRWWFTLSKQWPDTVELLDWAKIESLATKDGDR